MTHLARVAQLIYNQCHFITPSAATAIISALGERIGANGFVGDWAVDEATRKPQGYRLTARGTAIIPIVGELVNRGAWLGAQSGLVSYEGLRQQFQNAGKDPRVARVILDINSPGGQAAGMIETAAHLRELSRQKPVVAYANTLMASAAYGIASGATRIVSARFASVGSIGVLYVHEDHSRRLDREGVTVTLIHAGQHKADGNPFEPLPAPVRAEISRLVDRHYDAFVETVVTGRPSLSAETVRATEARVYDADDALEAGLIDEIATFDELLARFEGGAFKAGPVVIAGRSSPQPKRTEKMNDAAAATMATDAPGWATMTLAELNEAVASLRGTIGVEPSAQVVDVAAVAPAANPEAPASEETKQPQAASEPVARGYDDGRRDERARISAILGCEAAATRPTQARVIALESDMAADQATEMLAKLPSEAKNSTREFYGAVQAAGAVPNVPTAEASANAGFGYQSGLVAGAREMNAARRGGKNKKETV